MTARSPYGFVRRFPLGRIDVPEQATPALPTVRWVPTTEAEAEDWAVEQAKAWTSPEMEAAVGATASAIQGDLAYDPQIAAPMSADQTSNWAQGYVAQNGFPTSAADAETMTREFLQVQGTQMGMHPSFVGAYQLVVNFPDTPEAARQWMVEVGGAFAANFGIPLTTPTDPKGFVLASSGAAMAQAGVPYAGAVIMAADTLWDGTVTEEELKGIVGTVGSVVGAAIGQAFGIPAPIGALIGSLVATLIFEGLGSLFGWGDDAKKAAAIHEANRVRAAMMEQCFEVGVGAWTQYQEYWNAVIPQMQRTLDENHEWLMYSGGYQGLRYFGRTFIESIAPDDPRRCKEAIRLVPSFLRSSVSCDTPLPRPINQQCDSLGGCPYYPGNSGSPISVRYNAPRDGAYPLYDQPALGNIYPSQGAIVDGRVEAYAALAWYGADRFVTPYHALRTQMGLTPPGPVDQVSFQASSDWDRRQEQNPWSIVQTDEHYIKSMSYIRRAERVEDLTPCAAFDWAEALMASTTQVAPAMALIARDMSGTIAAAISEYRIQQAMALAAQTVPASASPAVAQYRAVQSVTSLAAAQRRDLIRLRRQMTRAQQALNGGLLAGGVGLLAGWGITSLRGPK